MSNPSLLKEETKTTPILGALTPARRRLATEQQVIQSIVRVVNPAIGETTTMVLSAKEIVAFKGFVGLTVCIYLGPEIRVRA